MKISDSRQFSAFVSRVLVLVGIVLLTAFVVDCILLFFPSDQPNQLSSLEGTRWQVNLLTQIVDRGIVPLMGLVLLVIGLWVDAIFGTVQAGAKARQNLGMGAFLFASLLGLVFLLIVPLHANNSYRAYQKTLDQIKQEATQAESQLGNQLAQEVARQRGQIDQLLKDDQRLQQAIAQGQVGQQEATLLQQFKSNPKALEQFVQQRSGEFRNQIQTQIRTRQEDARKAASVQFLRSGLRITVLSLLLAIGFVTIGWTGLKNLNSSRTERRKSPARTPQT